MLKIALTTLLCLNSLLIPTSSIAETVLTAQKEIVWDDFLGVNAHFLWFTPDQYAKQMTQLKALGLSWVRVDLHWDRHETSQDKFNLKPVDTLVKKMDSEHLHSLLYLVGSAHYASSAPFYARNKDQYPPKKVEVFANRMGLLAKRYPSVDAWQVWNEPNLPAYWQPKEDPEAYSKLLYASTQELKRVAPSKKIVMAGMAYYSQMPYKGGLMLEEMAKLGALNIGAIIDYHPYALEPEGDDPKAMDFIRRCQEINQRLRSINVPAIWASEWGWSSYDGPKEEQPIIGENGQANYTLKRLAMIATLDFDKTFLFALSDLDSRAGARDQHYGLLDLNGNPKPVYHALKRFFDITGPRLQPATPPNLNNAPAEIISVAWKKPDGTNLWMLSSKSERTVTTKALSKAVLHNPIQGKRTELTASNGTFTIPVSDELQILEWK